MSDIKVCQWLDSNRGPLVSEATALPTEPQPLPRKRSLSFSLFSLFKFEQNCPCFNAFAPPPISFHDYVLFIRPCKNHLNIIYNKLARFEWKIRMHSHLKTTYSCSLCPNLEPCLMATFDSKILGASSVMKKLFNKNFFSSSNHKTAFSVGPSLSRN